MSEIEETTPRGRAAPGPRGDFLLGHVRHMRRDAPGFLLSLMREHGDVARFRLGPVSAFLVSHPEGVRRVLVDDAARYSKESRGYAKMKIALGDGLVTSDGALWRRQRRIIQPAFTGAKIARFASMMVRAAEEEVDVWREHAEAGRAFDVAARMMRVTFRIAGEAFVGVDLRGRSDAVYDALAVVGADIIRRINAPLDLPLRIPTPHNRRVRAALRVLDDMVNGVIARRRAGESGGDDVLSHLMLAKDEETGEGMSDAQLRDEVMTTLLAGHETTANALAWTWYLLGQTPAVEAKLHAELDAVLPGRSPTIDDLVRLPYTKCVVQEAMRLYPPAWIMARTAITDTEVSGYRIPKGSVVFLSPWVTHRHASAWKDPEAFAPERFAKETPPRFAYFPFGGGPRSCIGSHFAMMELPLVLATLARRCRLTLAPGRVVERDPQVTLRTRSGIWVTAAMR